MAKVTFTDDIKTRPARQTYPKLRLKKDEKARIQLVDISEIQMEYIHNLEAPVIENGQGVMMDGGKYKMRYMGSPISFGDPGILNDRGLDPEHCPISKFAKEHPEWVKAPRRKFGMHILRYRTKPNSHEIAKPFSVEHNVWLFSDKVWETLKGFANEWGDLRQRDLLLTCTNETFQTFEITIANKAEWLADATTTKANFTMAQETYKAGVEEFPDLTEALGSKKREDWVIEDLAEIEEAWSVVLGRKVATSQEAQLDGIIGSGVASTSFPPATTAAPAAQASDPVADIFAGLSDDSDSSVGDSEELPGSFDDLLSSLK